MLRVVAVTALVILTATAAHADPTVTAGADIYSSYIWRGFELCDDPVVQPSVTLAGEALSFNVWGSFDAGDRGRCTELDYTLAHPFRAGDLEASVGFIYYTFPNLTEGRSTQEVFATLTRPGRVPVTLAGYYDYRLGDGLYAELGAAVPVRVAGGDGSLALALGYNEHQWREGSGLSHLQAKLSRPIGAGRVTVSPVVGYSLGLSHDFSDHLFVGVSAGMALP
jgi:hypothetical protein